MVSPTLGWSLVQLRLANQDKMQPIGQVMNLVVDVEGMRARAEFHVIEVINGKDPIPRCWGLDGLMTIWT